MKKLVIVVGSVLVILDIVLDICCIFYVNFVYYFMVVFKVRDVMDDLGVLRVYVVIKV